MFFNRSGRSSGHEHSPAQAGVFLAQRWRKLLLLLFTAVGSVFCDETVVSFNYGSRWSQIVFDDSDGRLYLSVPANGQQGAIRAHLSQSQLQAILQAASNYDGQIIRNALDVRDTDGDGVSDYVEISAGLKYWDADSNFQNFTTDLTEISEHLSRLEWLLAMLVGFSIWHCWDISARRKNFY